MNLSIEQKGSLWAAIRDRLGQQQLALDKYSKADSRTKMEIQLDEISRKLTDSVIKFLQEEVKDGNLQAGPSS